MKVLVIPDVHLRPRMFQLAHTLLERNIAECAVCLMDIPDDWDQEYNIPLYEKTFDEAINFARVHPDALWCYGNHDLSYMWHQPETGYSSIASHTVQKKLLELRRVLPEGNEIQYIQRIDNVLFMHGGLLDDFVRAHVSSSKYHDIDIVVDTINQLGLYEMWINDSPIWARPQYGNRRLYKPRKLLQVVGHTPIREITRSGNLISCDVFSTFRNGEPIGTEEFLVIDTVTWEYQGIGMRYIQPQVQ